jgi:hypothetical protein
MTNRLNLPGALAIEIAEGQTNALTDLSEVIEQVQWDLDAALSAIHKDEVGYRRKNAANHEGGDNYAEGELEDASRRARQLLLALSPVAELAQRWKDNGRLADAINGNVVHLGAEFYRGNHEDHVRRYNRRGFLGRLFSWRWSDIADVAA